MQAANVPRIFGLLACALCFTTADAAVTSLYSATAQVSSQRAAGTNPTTVDVTQLLNPDSTTPTVLTTTTSYASGPIVVGDEVYPSGTGTATVTANLREGKFGTYASGAVLTPTSSAVVQAATTGGYTDTLSFSVAGADANTITEVSFRLSSEGSMRIDSRYADDNGFEDGSSYLAGFQMTTDGHGDASGSKIRLDTRLGYVLTDSSFSTFPTSIFSQGEFGTPDYTFFTSFDVLASNAYYAVRMQPRELGTTDEILVVARLIGASPTLTLTTLWAAQTRGGEVDFAHTATLGISTPANVAWTSASGILLVSAVPEPATAALMVLGLAGLLRRATQRHWPTAAAH